MTAAESGQLIVVLSALILEADIRRKISLLYTYFLYWHLKTVD